MAEIEIRSQVDGNRTVDLDRVTIVRRVARRGDEGQLRAYVLNAADVPPEPNEIARRGSLVAEWVKGLWRDTAGAALNDEAQQALESMRQEGAVVTALVRDGTLPLPPKSYWHEGLRRYVSPDDEEWSSEEYRAAVALSS